MSQMNTIDWIAFVLVIVGALNWGLVALGFNLVEFLFSSVPIVMTIIYALVGLSALYMIYSAATKK